MVLTTNNGAEDLLACSVVYEIQEMSLNSPSAGVSCFIAETITHPFNSTESKFLGSVQLPLLSHRFSLKMKNETCNMNTCLPFSPKWENIDLH